MAVEERGHVRVFHGRCPEAVSGYITAFARQTGLRQCPTCPAQYMR